MAKPCVCQQENIQIKIPSICLFLIVFATKWNQDAQIQAKYSHLFTLLGLHYVLGVYVCKAKRYLLVKAVNRLFIS